MSRISWVVKAEIIRQMCREKQKPENVPTEGENERLTEDVSRVWVFSSSGQTFIRLVQNCHLGLLKQVSVVCKKNKNKNPPGQCFSILSVHWNLLRRL